MVKRTLFVAVVVVFGSVAVAHAQKGEATPKVKEVKPKPPEGMSMDAPKRDPALDQYKDMIGTWRCKGTMKMGGKEMATRSTAKMKWDLDKFWVVATFSSPKTKTMPGYKGISYFGYDPTTKMYVSTHVDNMGGWGRTTSKGWQNDVQEWNGTAQMMGSEMKVKSTITRKGPREVAISDTMGTGPMAMTSESVCKK